MSRPHFGERRPRRRRSGADVRAHGGRSGPGGGQLVGRVTSTPLVSMPDDTGLAEPAAVVV